MTVRPGVTSTPASALRTCVSTACSAAALRLFLTMSGSTTGFRVTSALRTSSSACARAFSSTRAFSFSIDSRATVSSTFGFLSPPRVCSSARARSLSSTRAFSSSIDSRATSSFAFGFLSASFLRASSSARARSLSSTRAFSSSIDSRASSIAFSIRAAKRSATTSITAERISMIRAAVAGFAQSVVSVDVVSTRL